MTTRREDQIRQRAHQLWEEQGRPEGQHEEHWRQASSEIGDDGDDGMGGDTPPSPHLQEDPPEGDRGTIESELARRQYDDLENGKGQG
ncbi:DUF2934 domain-containing protein [Paracoccus angustae]|uniref:DUF2934 domain-containing protein n=1 Tax=Paracoccus angustae TaxID=1671480 RepID=A0ABV7U826_9RHOB